MPWYVILQPSAIPLTDFNRSIEIVSLPIRVKCTWFMSLSDISQANGRSIDALFRLAAANNWRMLDRKGEIQKDTENTNHILITRF
jgi:hypothetical protein